MRRRASGQCHVVDIVLMLDMNSSKFSPPPTIRLHLRMQIVGPDLMRIDLTESRIIQGVPLFPPVSR